MVNRVSSYFPKGGHSATQNRTKNNMNTRKVKLADKEEMHSILDVFEFWPDWMT